MCQQFAFDFQRVGRMLNLKPRWCPGQDAGFTQFSLEHGHFFDESSRISIEGTDYDDSELSKTVSQPHFALIQHLP